MRVQHPFEEQPIENSRHLWQDALWATCILCIIAGLIILLMAGNSLWQHVIRGNYYNIGSLKAGITHLAAAPLFLFWLLPGRRKEKQTPGADEIYQRKVGQSTFRQLRDQLHGVKVEIPAEVSQRYNGENNLLAILLHYREWFNASHEYCEQVYGFIKEEMHWLITKIHPILIGLRIISMNKGQLRLSSEGSAFMEAMEELKGMQRLKSN